MLKSVSLTPGVVPVWRGAATVGGVVRLAYTDKGLYALELPDDGQMAFPLVSDDDPLWLQELAEDLHDYFAGEVVCFSPPLDDRDYPPFYRRVLAATVEIPYGESRNYRWLAEQAESPKAVRAAGQAMANNRTPVVVPCHRVLRSDGTLGGFSGGLHWKKRLLSLEKVLGEDLVDAD